MLHRIEEGLFDTPSWGRRPGTYRRNTHDLPYQFQQAESGRSDVRVGHGVITASSLDLQFIVTLRLYLALYGYTVAKKEPLQVKFQPCRGSE